MSQEPKDQETRDKDLTINKESTIHHDREKTNANPEPMPEVMATEEIIPTGDTTGYPGTDDIQVHGLLSTSEISREDTIDELATAVSPGADGDPDMETVATPGSTADTAQQATDVREKTSVMFSLTDITKKLEDEIANIPENYDEDLAPDEMSMVIKEYFPGRTEEEKIRINRNFLRDAEPFNLEKLVEQIKRTPPGPLTGFKNLDSQVGLPTGAVTLVTSRPKHGKTVFLLNLLVNMSSIYRDKHFLYYSYNESKEEILLKLINMCGTRQFSRSEGTTAAPAANLERWKQEIKNTTIADLLSKADTHPEYGGLKYLMAISPNLHVMDGGHHIADLLDSIRSFGKAFEVGAVFIDSLDKIRPGGERTARDRREQLSDISGQLRKAAYETRFPIILAAPLTPGPKGTPEYDELWEGNLAECGNPDHDAALVFGLQNYARSRYIGSNIDGCFSSKMLGESLEKAQLMPNNFKDMMQKTILLTKVMANKAGPEPELELIFHKQLLRITD